MDECAISQGELYTFVTNKDAHGGKGALVAIVAGTKSEDVCAVLEKIPLRKRKLVKEIAVDLSSSMMRIARNSFPHAFITNDRFTSTSFSMRLLMTCESVTVGWRAIWKTRRS